MGDSTRIRIKVAEIVFGIDVKGSSIPDQVFEDYRLFLTSDEPDLAIAVSESALPAMFPMESHRVFEAWERWSLYRIEEQHVLVQRHPVSSAIPDRIMIIDKDFEQGELFVRSPWSVQTGQSSFPNPLDYPLGHVLMVWLLGRGRGLMVHACGVNDEGRGYLMAGNSGHGKTTLAELWEHEACVLNDDRVVLRKRDGRFWMYGTPWRGRHKSVSPEGVPVDRVFFPKHAARNGVERVVGVRASSMILTRSFPPIWDANGMSYTLDFLSELTSQVPCYELSFSPDERVRDFMRCVK